MHAEGLSAHTNVMGALSVDHDQSVESHAVEKYLLGELSAEESEAFVEHFFECEACAGEVRLGYHFRENARAVFGQEKRPPVLRHPEPNRKSVSWFAWLRPAVLASATCLLLSGITAYQNLAEIPSLRSRIGQLEQPRIVEAGVVVPPASRGPATVIGVASADTFFHLGLAVNAVPPAAEYVLELHSDSGTTIARMSFSKLEPESNLTLSLPASKFPAGSYRAVLFASDGQTARELERYRFAIHFN